MVKYSQIPVLVVGSGAAGTLVALELARHGIAARVVDKLPAPLQQSRAVTVHARTLEIFELIDPKLAQRFLERGVKSPGYVMHYVDAAGKRRDVRPGLDFRELPSPYPFLLVHSQDETEATLRSYLKERHGGDTEWGRTCTAVQQHGNFVEVTLETDDGDLETVRCQYLVACDGANSRIRQLLAFAHDSRDFTDTVLQNLDVELLGFPDDDAWIHYCMGPGHFVMVAKMQNGYTRLLMSQSAEKADAKETPQSVFGGILARHFDGVRFGKTQWHSRWASQVRLARTYRKGNVFLAGDAAHVHSTAGGQGMNCCMQDAFNLGWKLALVVKEEARPELLDTYDSERKPIGKQVVDAASKIHELFMAGRNSDADALLALRQSGALAELVGKVSGLAYHYRCDSDVATHDAMPRAGDRMPNPVLQGTHAGKPLSHLLHHGEFTLLLCTHDPHHVLELPLRRGVVNEVLAPAPQELLSTDAAPQLYLVRPDGYLALRCAATEPGLVAAYLTRIFR
jgi:2-polyprenyl-6-methoxyphenol hydroxylase-like FAD-dependent oxidoreductase